MVQRMAKLADIKHVSGSMTEDMRTGLHRYLKEQAAEFVSSNAGAYITGALHAGAGAGALQAGAAPFIIPAKTFAFLVQKAAAVKMSADELDAFHHYVEDWWLELFKRSKRIADHREHAVVQWKDVELVIELAHPLSKPKHPEVAGNASAVAAVTAVTADEGNNKNT